MVLQATTERISVYSRRGRGVDVARLERSLETAERQLGHKFSGRLQYFEYDYPEEVAFATGKFATGVTYAAEGQVHAVAQVSDHEIVHAVAWQLGNPGNFFHEGLAVAVADKGKWWGRDVNRAAKALARRASLSTVIASFNGSEPGDGYYVAGSFVSWLIKTQGWEKVATFFHECSGEGTAPAAFAQVFGRSLDAAGAEWAASL